MPWFSPELWIIAALVLGAVVIGFPLFARWCAESPAVPYPKLQALRAGMSMDEVEALIGKPRDRRRSRTGHPEWLYGLPMKQHELRIEFDDANRLRLFVHSRYPEAVFYKPN